MQPQGTVFYHFYRGVAALTAPIVWRQVSRKLARAGVTPNRQRERLGHATLPRPDGPLAWFHAASVGESLSVLTLAQQMQALRPGLKVLITSGTASSAEILAKRLPVDMIHQFAPLDQRPALSRFLGHWRPDAAIFVESEIWPQMLVEAQGAGVPLALVNARMSKGTLKSWQRFDHTARYLLGLFQLIRTQDRATLDGLLTIGADPAQVALGPNLKAVAAPLPVDKNELARLRQALAGPVWLAASTHEGEEKHVIKALKTARLKRPDLRLILAPRHPDRAERIADQIRSAGLSVARRSAGAPPDQCDVYLADSYGEMGLWYALSQIVFLGGSLGNAGGHNPYEPAQAGCTILVGPRLANFADVYAAFETKKAVIKIKDAKSLGRAVAKLSADPELAKRTGLNAQTLAENSGQEIQDLAKLLIEKLLP